MQRRQRNESSPFEGRLLHFATKLLIFTIAFSLVLDQSISQRTDDPDRIHFPGPSGRSDHRISEEPVEKLNSDERMLSASLKIAQRINSIESYDEFLRFVGGPVEADIQLADRFGGGTERSNAEKPLSARCQPELTSVSLKTDNNPAKFIYPPCTRINRCGGCCTNNLLSCQPTSTEIRNFKVAVSRLDEDLQLTYEGKEIVALEEHTACMCDCRIKPEHCNHKQIYKKDICKCICTNTDEEQKCRSNNHTKLWDVDNCTCLCREVNECATGFYFDQKTCRCQKIPLRFQDFATRTGYNLGQTQRPESIPPVIVTLDATDPRRKPKDDPEY